jgi:hypothetical protein
MDGRNALASGSPTRAGSQFQPSGASRAAGRPGSCRPVFVAGIQPAYNRHGAANEASVSFLFPAFAFCALAFGAPQDPRPAGVPVVTVEPACAGWTQAASGDPILPPHIVIRYDPRSPGARLASSRSLTLVVAGKMGVRYQSTAIPMARTADGAWQAEYIPKLSFPGCWIFFFQDEKGRLDDNSAQYWDILVCRDPWPVIEQASTYEGRLLAPGIQRPPDLRRALDILKNALSTFPNGELYFSIWQYELEFAGESAAAYEQVGRKLDAFISAHGDNSYCLHEVVGFVASRQQKLPPRVVQHFRDAVTALPRARYRYLYDHYDHASGTYRRLPMDEFSRPLFEREARAILAELDFAAIGLEQVDPRKKRTITWPLPPKIRALRVTALSWPYKTRFTSKIPEDAPHRNKRGLASGFRRRRTPHHHRAGPLRANRVRPCRKTRERGSYPWQRLIRLAVVAQAFMPVWVFGPYHHTTPRTPMSSLS